jgi:PAS domain S-box-containing protein
MPATGGMPQKEASHGAAAAWRLSADFSERLQVHYSGCPLRASRVSHCSWHKVSVTISGVSMKDLSEQTRLALLASILGTATDAIVAVDEKQRILLFNRGAERVFGYRAEEVLGQSLDMLLPAESVGAHRARVAAVAAAPEGTCDRNLQWEMRGRRKDGSEFPAEASISRFTEGGRTVLTVIMRDIVQRKQRQEALRESEERYRSIVAAMSEGIVLQDASGHIIECNDAAQRILGLTRDQMMGMSSLDPHWRAIHEDGSPFAGEDHPAKITLRTGQPRTGVVMGVHKPDGMLTWISINSQPLARPGEAAPYAVVTSFTDITERWQTEQALRESEDGYRLLFENSLDGILLTAPDGRIFAANAAACRMFGRTEEEICRLGRDGLVDASDPRLVIALEERGRTGRIQQELFHLRRDGTRFAAEVSSSMFRDRQGNLRSSMIVRDITAHVRAETELHEQEALLRNILELLPVGVWILDRDGQILSGNEASLRLWAGARYVGIDQYGEYKAWWADSGKRVGPEEWGAARALTKGEVCLNEVVNIECFDGTHKTILNSAIPIRDAKGEITGAVAVNQDITERVQAYQLLERRVEERTRDLSALLEVSRDVASMLELDPLLDAILTRLGLVVEHSGVGIALFEEGKRSLKIVDYRGSGSRDRLLQISIPLDRDSGYRQVVEGQRPVIIDDIRADTPWITAVRAAWDQESLTSVGAARSWLGVPLIARGDLVGVLRLDHSEPNHFTERDARLTLAFADYAALAMSNARLYEQARRLAALEERQRLARELHDSISQTLYAIALGARTARAQLDREPRKAVQPLEYLLSLAEAAFADMRALIFELRPEALEAQGLTEAITQQVEFLRARHGVKVEAQLGDEPAVSLEIKEALHRIVQEALYNIVKHARTHEVQLSLTYLGSDLILEVGDNGIGFDPGAPLSGHMGLRSMRERAERLGGTFELQSRPGGGTHIRVQIPVSAQEADAPQNRQVRG